MIALLSALDFIGIALLPAAFSQGARTIFEGAVALGGGFLLLVYLLAAAVLGRPSRQLPLGFESVQSDQAATRLAGIEALGGQWFYADDASRSRIVDALLAGCYDAALEVQAEALRLLKVLQIHMASERCEDLVRKVRVRLQDGGPEERETSLVLLEMLDGD